MSVPKKGKWLGIEKSAVGFMVFFTVLFAIITVAERHYHSDYRAMLLATILWASMTVALVMFITETRIPSRDEKSQK